MASGGVYMPLGNPEAYVEQGVPPEVAMQMAMGGGAPAPTAGVAPPPFADLAPSGLFPDLDPMAYAQHAMMLQQQGQAMHQQMSSQAMMQAAAMLGMGAPNPYEGGLESGIPYGDLMPS